MRIENHILISTIVSVPVYLVTRNMELSLSFFLSNIFIDLDHLFDYFYNGKRDSIRLIQRPVELIKDFFYKCNKYRLPKFHVWLHSYELILALLVIAYLSKSYIIAGIFSGFAVHVFSDAISNSRCLWSYFFVYRFMCRFDIKKIFKKKKDYE